MAGQVRMVMAMRLPPALDGMAMRLPPALDGLTAYWWRSKNGRYSKRVGTFKNARVRASRVSWRKG
jgi:hypothetical protein